MRNCGGFSAIFRGKPQRFSAVETCWRREVNSNSWYAFCNLSMFRCLDSKSPSYRNDVLGSMWEARRAQRESNGPDPARGGYCYTLYTLQTVEMATKCREERSTSTRCGRSVSPCLAWRRAPHTACRHLKSAADYWHVSLLIVRRNRLRWPFEWVSMIELNCSKRLLTFTM